MNKKLIDVSLVCWLLAASCAQELHAAPVSGSSGAARTRVQIDNGGLSDADLKKLSAIEFSHFQRNFDQDPAAKRIKRVELFLAGMGQEGTLKERLNGLSDLTRKPGGAQASAPSKFGASQSITQLELSINKKADPKLEVTTRLANLEKKVFGTPFPSLSVQQRIARLQKTIGTASNEDLAQGMPGTLQEFGSMSRQFPPGMMHSFSYQLMPNESSDPDVSRQMSEMFDHLNLQLRQLHRIPPGYGQTQPRQFSDQGGGGYDFSDGLPPIPQERVQKIKPSLPPYMDPNSI